MFTQIYNAVVYHPILNLLVVLYKVIPDIGVVIIIVTILIRLALAPSFHKSLKSQKEMNALQPKLNAVREKHKDNKEAQAKAMMDLYKEHKISPFGSCLPLLLQLPILIALYQVFSKALTNHLTGLYSFVHFTGTINPKFFNLIDLSKAGWGNGMISWPGIVLAVLAGVAQFWQSKMMMPKADSTTVQDSTTRIMQAQTTYFLPLFTIYIGTRWPAGLPLYWLVTTLFSVAQQYYIMRKEKPASN
jgi:YidC/Oxa1 family membrane protein insertase